MDYDQLRIDRKERTAVDHFVGPYDALLRIMLASMAPFVLLLAGLLARDLLF